MRQGRKGRQAQAVCSSIQLRPRYATLRPYAATRRASAQLDTRVSCPCQQRHQAVPAEVGGCVEPAALSAAWCRGVCGGVNGLVTVTVTVVVTVMEGSVA